MFKFLSLQERLISEANNRKKLWAELEKKTADLEYLAMMCNVELNDETMEVSENE